MAKYKKTFEGFSQRIKAERKKTNLTQDELSYMLGFGDKYIAKLESNSNAPSLNSVIYLADYFNVSVDYLLFGERIKENEQLSLLCSNLSEQENNFVIQLLRFLIQHNHNVETVSGFVMDKHAFGQHIKNIRRSKKISRKELAEIINLSLSSISEIELGRRLPSLPVFCEISKALKTTPNELLSTVMEIKSMNTNYCIEGKMTNKIKTADKK